MSMVTKKEKLEGGRRVSEAKTLPEGGWGWMIVAACFLATICIRAVTRCVSIFFVEFQLHFEKDYSTTAWIHSMIDCITMVCAPLGGLLGNHLSCRATVILGGVLSSAGLILSSFTSSLEQLYICMGLLTGLGFALSYTPAIAMVGKYFNERKALAYGIAMSGNGIGTFILAPAVQLFIEHYSWRGALLMLGGFVSNLCVCGALMRPVQPTGGGRALENKMENLEKDYMKKVLDSEDTNQLSADSSQTEPQQMEINHLMETQSLLLANGGPKNLNHANVAPLSSLSLPDQSLTDVKIAESILFSNKLTETVVDDMKCSHPRVTNGSKIEDLKSVESINLNNKTHDTDAKDSGLSKAKGAEAYVQPLPEPAMRTKPAFTSWICFRSREEFGFLFLPTFLILAVSFLFLAYGCSAPVVHLVPYALSLGVAHQQAAFLMSIFGVSGIVGNITFGWITDRKCLRRYGMLNYMIAVGMEGLCCMFVPLLRSFSLLVPFTVLYGYFDGAYVALIPVITSDVVGSTHLTSALGVVHFLHAIPYLVSPPIGGLLVDRTGNYNATFLLSGVSFIFSAMVLAAAVLLRCHQGSKSHTAANSNSNNINAAAT